MVRGSGRQPAIRTGALAAQADWVTHRGRKVAARTCPANQVVGQLDLVFPGSGGGLRRRAPCPGRPHHCHRDLQPRPGEAARCRGPAPVRRPPGRDAHPVRRQPRSWRPPGWPCACPPTSQPRSAGCWRQISCCWQGWSGRSPQPKLRWRRCFPRHPRRCSSACPEWRSCEPRTTVQQSATQHGSSTPQRPTERRDGPHPVRVGRPAAGRPAHLPGGIGTAAVGDHRARPWAVTARSRVQHLPPGADLARQVRIGGGGGRWAPVPPARLRDAAGSASPRPGEMDQVGGGQTVMATSKEAHQSDVSCPPPLA